MIVGYSRAAAGSGYASTYSFSGGGATGVNGTYTQAGTFNSVPYWTHGSYYLFWAAGINNCWFIAGSLSNTANPFYHGSTTQSPATIKGTYANQGYPPPNGTLS
jgi:hypothetical protein